MYVRTTTFQAMCKNKNQNFVMKRSSPPPPSLSSSPYHIDNDDELDNEMTDDDTKKTNKQKTINKLLFFKNIFIETKQNEG